MEQIKGQIKNRDEIQRLLDEGWTVDTDQENNPGQLNHPTNNTDWYDAETDTYHTV